MQFGFLPAYETSNAIFILRQLKEKYSAKKKDLFFAFLDLAKAFYLVARDVVGWP